jgi:hypothetical protein
MNWIKSIINGHFQFLIAKKNDSTVINQANTINNYYNVPVSSNLLLNFTQEKATDIKKLIDDGKIVTANDELTRIMTIEGFGALEPINKVEFHFLKGLIGLVKDDISTVKDCIQNILSLKTDEKKAYELRVKLALQTNNEALFQSAISDLFNSGVNEIGINLLKAYFSFENNDYQAVFELLTNDGTIKEEYKDNLDARHLLGITFFNSENISSAKFEFEYVNQIKPFPYNTYMLIICDIQPIVSRPGAIKSITPKERDLLKERLEQLTALKSYYDDQDLALKTQFYRDILMINLFLDSDTVEIECNKLSNEITDNIHIKKILADSYIFGNKFEKAEELYKVIYSQDNHPEVLCKYLSSLMHQKKYQLVVSIVNTLTYDKYDLQGQVVGDYIFSLSQIDLYEKVQKKIIELEKTFNRCPLFYEASADVAYNSGDFSWANELIRKGIKLIIADDDSLRMVLAAACVRIEQNELAISLLMPYYKFNYNSKKFLIDLLLKSQNPAYLKIVSDLVDEEIQGGTKDVFFYNTKADLLFFENPKEALKFLEISYSFVQNINVLYNIVGLKIQLQDLSDSSLDSYIRVLLDADSPKCNMLGVHALYLLKRGDTEKLGYKALYQFGEEFDELIYRQYIILFLPCNYNIFKDKIEFNTIVEDVVIELVDEDGLIKKICIDTNPRLIQFDGETRFNCQHYMLTSPISIALLGNKKDTQVNLDGRNYLIKKIINKYVHLFHYCLEKYASNCPESDFLTAIKVTPEDPFTPIIPMLEKSNEIERLKLSQYNFTNNFGLPIISLSSHGANGYLDTVLKLSSLKDQIIYAGEVNNYLVKEQPVILSLSSFVFLNLLKKLELINTLKNCYIPESLYQAILGIFENVRTLESLSAGSLSLESGGRVVYNHYSEEQHQSRLNFWRDILTVIADSVNIIPLDEKYSIYNISKFEQRFEIDPIFLTHQLNGIFISDDLFLRRLARISVTGIKTTNTVSILYMLIESNPDELINAILSLSHNKYHFCISEYILCSIIDYIVSKPMIIGEGTNLYKLEQVVKNLLSNEVLFREYLPVFRSIIHRYYIRKLNPCIEHILLFLIRNLKISNLTLEQISEENLLNYLKEPYNLDIFRKKYIEELFKAN